MTLRRREGEHGATGCFVAVVFESADAAEEALAAVRQVGAEKDVSVRDAVVVARTERGRIELKQTQGLAAGEGIVGGGAAGLVAGVLLGVPVAGALLGVVGGTVLGLRDTGIPDKRLRKVGEDLEPGQALLCVLVDSGRDRMHDALAGYGPVYDVDLSARSSP